MISKLNKEYNDRYCYRCHNKGNVFHVNRGENPITRDYLSMPVKNQEQFAQGADTFVEYY